MLAFDLTGFGYTLLVVLGISLLIFIHELGHFLAAKMAGVRVDAFSLGFGPRLFGFQRGDTDYRVSAVPLGGYVKMYGEVPGEGDPHDASSLFGKSVPWRFLIFAGGVLMNLLFALIAFPIVFRAGVPFTAPVVGSVEPGSPAWQAGIAPGDRVVLIDDAPVYSFDQLAMEAALAGDAGVRLRLQRGDGHLDVTVHPVFDRRIGLKMLGLRPPSDDEVTVGLLADPSPARAAGLRSGDRLVAWDGALVTPAVVARLELEQQRDPVAALKRPLRLAVDRGGERVEVELQPVAIDDPNARLGVMPLVTKVAGIRTEVDAPTRRALAELGLVEGDLVIGLIEGGRARPVLDGEDLAASLDRAGDDVALQVLRAGPGAQEIGGAPRRILPVPKGLRGGEAKRVLAHVAFATDDLTGSVYVQPGHAAAQAGLRTGDRLLMLAGKEVRSWLDVVRTVSEARRAGQGSLRVRWQPFTEQPDAQAAPREAEVAMFRAPLASYGFAPVFRERKETYRVAGFLPSLQAGFVCSMDTLRQLYVTLKRILAGSVSAENLGGIITISVATYETARSGWQRFLYFLAILSLNLAFINILPIPVLDGGQLLFLGIEAIKGSPVSIRVMNYAQIVGLVLVLALMIFVTFNDIRRLFG